MKWIGILLIIGLLAGCEYNVNDKMLDGAIEHCKNNGGIAKITVWVDGSKRTTCKNGAEFQV